MTTSDHELTLHSDGPQATLAIGRALGRAAESGLVIALIGPLGAGKTLLVRGIAEGLDVVDARAVSSPTFVLIQEYAARLPIYHFDTYRLTDANQFAALGPDEYFEGDGVCLVEWADRVADLLPADRLDVRFLIQGPTTRLLSLRTAGDPAIRLLARLGHLR
jgi:tRNA threonylcarbamoyladenosine biosynthesis protein TsaE